MERDCEVCKAGLLYKTEGACQACLYAIHAAHADGTANRETTAACVLWCGWGVEKTEPAAPDVLTTSP